MSKLTLHFQGIPPFASEFVRESGVEYVKVIDPPEGEMFPGVKTLGRTYMPDAEANVLVAQGAAGGEAWFDRWLPIYESRPYIYAWESPNEPHPMRDRSFRLALNEFLIVWSGLMRDHGWKTIGGCFSIGWPDIGTAPDVGLGLEMCDFMGVHEYSAPTMDTRYPWHCGRYRLTVEELRLAGFEISPVMVTECGIDGGVEPLHMHGTGWKTFATEDQYLDQLAWYDNLLMEDDYVEAATIFVAGPNSDWMDFEVTESLAGKLADYIVATPNPEPEPDTRARGIDVSRYQGDINWDLVKADGYDFVIIRASGPNNDRTAVEADPRFSEYYDGAGAAGLLRGAYHGLQPNFGGQALLFVSTVGDRELELGYFSDLEIRELTDEKVTAHLLAVDERIEEFKGIPADGKPTGVYTNPSFMVGRDTSWGEGRTLWIAHWTDDDEPYVPEPWETYEFWQHGVEDPGYVNGIDARIDLDKYNGTVEELYEKYKPDSGGEDDMVEVVDLNGNPIENGWEEAVARGASVISATVPEGETVWRVKTLILDTGGSMAFRLYAKDGNGVPLPRIVMFQGWDSNEATVLPADAAPMLTEAGPAQPDGLPNRALVLDDQFSNVDGYLEWTWGPGEFLDPNQPAHWCWVMPGGEEWYSDVVYVPGWWDEHIKYWVVFTQEVGDVDPEPEDPDGDLAEVVVELRRIADATEYMVAHWPYK